MGVSPSVDLAGLIFGCWDRCSRRATCIWQLESNLEKLDKKKEDLVAKGKSVMRRVEDEERKGRVKTLPFAVWERRVDASVEEAVKLLSIRPEELEKLCLGGCCSKNFLSSIKFASKVTDRLDDVDALHSMNFDEVTQPREGHAEIPGDQPEGMDAMFDEVWKRLAEKDIGIVGLWGMGGVGKSTLARQIHNQFCATRKDLFPIWVGVSKDFNLDKVQEGIGKKLGLSNDKEWERQTPEERAIGIMRALNNMKFVLILDDIWESVDLSKVGVPCPTGGSESKIVITTRSQDVCGNMCGENGIPVKSLEDKDAWKLFTKIIPERILGNPDIRPLAVEVVRECKGLPLALRIISRVVSTWGTPEEWRFARDTLKNNASKFDEMENQVLSILKISFDNLANNMTRSCFLYCCLFPEDYEIEKDDLIDYLICEELIKRGDDGSNPRDKGYRYIGDLVRACLLEEVEEEGLVHVRMHDVLRDMALWIARSHEDVGERFFVKTGAQLIEIPSVDEWQGVKRMSLM